MRDRPSFGPVQGPALSVRRVGRTGSFYCSGCSPGPISGGVLRTSSAAWWSEGGVGMTGPERPGWMPMLDSSMCASGCAAAGGSCDSNQPLVSSDCAAAGAVAPLVTPVVAPLVAPFAPLTDAAGSTSSQDRPSPSDPPSRDNPSSALLNSLGTIHILFASPWAIFGSVCRYW